MDRSQRLVLPAVGIAILKQELSLTGQGLESTSSIFLIYQTLAGGLGKSRHSVEKRSPENLSLIEITGFPPRIGVSDRL